MKYSLVKFFKNEKKFSDPFYFVFALNETVDKMINSSFEENRRLFYKLSRCASKNKDEEYIKCLLNVINLLFGDSINSVVLGRSLEVIYIDADGWNGSSIFLEMTLFNFKKKGCLALGMFLFKVLTKLDKHRRLANFYKKDIFFLQDTEISTEDYGGKLEEDAEEDYNYEDYTTHKKYYYIWMINNIEVYRGYEYFESWGDQDSDTPDATFF